MTDHHFHNLRVRDMQLETDQAKCIYLAVPESLTEVFRYRHGQHLVFRTLIEGEEIRRNYSICSSVKDQELKVAVKKVRDGKFSTFANERLQVGDYLEVMPPEGSFNTELNPDNVKSYLAFAAGSGITPILSIVKSILEEEPQSQVSLVYANQSVVTMMFREKLMALKNRYLNRFNMVNLFSRETSEVEVLSGRINRDKVELLSDGLIDLQSVDEVFICGPQSMTREVQDTLVSLGIDERHIHFELFGIDPAQQTDSDRENVTNENGVLHEVAVIRDGTQVEFKLSSAGISILDTALSLGTDLPFACKGGVCCTCRAKLISGKVHMDVNYALEPDELEQGYILTCQAHPISDRVIIDYDQQ
ncbi:MAG: phenylacetate-CoA oxygenase/reductase subunit PaaK [Gammaproteobacteria bacterium]|nr:phenylacetate-CoA oxygenase/reductase subunit PaaK [Gammaproteobacteria bacterium]